MALAAIVALGLIGCEQQSPVTNPTDPTNPSSIFGLWQEQDKSGAMESDYMRFLTADEEAKDGEYFFGREWDTKDRQEKDLKYKGNGWFKWKISGTTLTIVELMDNGGAELPESYIVTTLNSTTLKLQDPNDKTDVETWVRQK